MSEPSYDTLRDFAFTLADLSADAIKPFFRTSLDVENKADGIAFDPVTAADRAAEAAIAQALKARFADHALTGEEFGTSGADDARYRWIVDPIDGTRSFIMGYPLWGTLIALMRDGRPLLGVMDQPFTRERYWSEEGGAHWQDAEGCVQQLNTRACARLEDAILSTTHPELFGEGHETDAFAAVSRDTRMTRFGGDCYAYCMLAAGHIDLIIEAGLKPFDVAALVPIIERAGGVISTWSGGDAAEGGRIVAAGDPRLHEQALRRLG